MAGDEPDPGKPTGYVNDFANVIDDSTKDRVTAICKELDQKAHAQIAVVTINTLGGADINPYASALFNRWGIGYKGDNPGILILLALSDRKWRIEIARDSNLYFRTRVLPASALRWSPT